MIDIGFIFGSVKWKFNNNKKREQQRWLSYVYVSMFVCLCSILPLRLTQISDSNNNMKWCSIYVKYILDLKVEWDCLQPATWRKEFVTERASWQAYKTNRWIKIVPKGGKFIQEMCYQLSNLYEYNELSTLVT